ncbi:MAG: hypothetical protein HND43_02005 [Armatimonadetes bacterium]|nr:hypothetical protein [Armatimonadota bacterium]NOG38155.1 hypothetical protein [Armatimonadota bacterium]GIK32848.1 MAG: hypothetical protein BroJett009_18400 [Armatimonadota bacterium]
MIVGLLGLAMAMCQPQGTLDRRDLPPVERNFACPSGTFVLRVFSDQDWKTREAIAELRTGKKQVWRRTLPHSFGPRDAVVLSDGKVVLFDEWINVASKVAITLLDERGQTVATFSYAEVKRISEQTSKDLTRGATLGPYHKGAWLSSKPTVSGNLVVVSAGNALLSLDCQKGTLKRSLER